MSPQQVCIPDPIGEHCPWLRSDEVALHDRMRGDVWHCRCRERDASRLDLIGLRGSVAASIKTSVLCCIGRSLQAVAKQFL